MYQQGNAATKAAGNKEQLACNYPAHECSGQRVNGYEYCIRHILEDKSAPYKLCSFMYAGNGRRCIMPAPKGDKRDNNGVHPKMPGMSSHRWTPLIRFCAEHARRAQLARQKSSRRHIPPPSSESLLLGLSHYSKAETNAAAANSSSKLENNSKRYHNSGGGDTNNLDSGQSGLEGKDSVDNEDPSDLVTRALNPFVEINAARVNGEASRILDYASESDSDVDVTIRGETAENMSSDAESVDSQLEDQFKHAGVYTAEEVMFVARDKLIRLQSLYIEQFRRLQHTLRERRRQYLHALKREKETLSSIYNQSRESHREQKLYEKLRALNHYHKRSGVEAVLHKKALERRAQATEGVTVRPAPTAKCIFTEGGVKCGERTLPVAKHCLKHILEDNHQVLFRPCSCRRADFVCQEPVPNILEGASCVYHTNLPPPPPNHNPNLGLKMEPNQAESMEISERVSHSLSRTLPVNEECMNLTNQQAEQCNPSSNTHLSEEIEETVIGDNANWNKRTVTDLNGSINHNSDTFNASDISTDTANSENEQVVDISVS